MIKLDISESMGFIESNKPTQYRLAKRNGELVLQGAFEKIQIFKDHNEISHIEWRDLETVEL